MRRQQRAALVDGMMAILLALLSALAYGTCDGQLAIVAVLTALYPAVTIVMARAILAERWSALQGTGLGIAAVAIALVSSSP